MAPLNRSTVECRPVTNRPDFFVVGAPKCGTTSLHRYLIGHPEIYLPRHPKEPHFFAADQLSKFGMRYPDDLPHYEALFADAGGAKRIGEASTSYLESPEAPQRIHEFNPDARIIAMLRDPIGMMHSLHAMRVNQGLERITDFGAALADERNRPGYGVVGNQSSVRYRDRARFDVMLPWWFAGFGRDRVHVMLLEDMAADPKAEFSRVLRFLDVDDSYEPDTYKTYNSRVWPRSLLLARLDARLSHYFVPRGVGDRVMLRASRLVRRVNRQRIRRPPVNPELRLRLEEELAPDVERLSTLLGRDLRQLWWHKTAEQGAGSVVAGG